MEFNKNQIIFNRWGHCLTRKASGIIAIFIIGFMFSCTIIDPHDGLRVPTSFKSSSISTNEVTLSWEWNTDYDVTHYYILSNRTADQTVGQTVGQTAGESLATIKANSEKSKNHYTVTNLTPNTDYTFHLKACGGWGCSTNSISVEVTTKPNAPENFKFVKAENTPTPLSLVWEAPPLGGAADYTLYWGNKVAENITDTKQSVSGLNPGTEYTFGLVACNKNDLCSATNSLTVTTPPKKVENLAIKETKSTEITITWTKPPTTTSYEVTKQKENGTVEKVDNDLGARDTEFKIVNLDPETKYIFSLRACNDAGCSDPVTVDGTTEKIVNPPANAPGNLRHTSVSSTAVELEWDIVTGATYYPVLYTNITSGGPEVSNSVDNDNKFATTGLTANTQYTFSVKACNDFGCSDQASSTNITTAPVTPQGFTSEAVTSTSVDLKWNVVDGATRYIVSGNGNIATNTGTTYTATGLNANTPYTFSMKACNDFGCSEATTKTLTTAPVAPENFTHGTVTSTTVALKWDMVDGAIQYDVYRDGYKDGNKIATIGGKATYTVSNLTANKKYTFSVQVCNEFRCSDFSDLQVTTSKPQDFFEISYPDMDSTVSDTSTPEIVNGNDCQLQILTDAGATYSISALTDGSQAVLPTIDSTGVVNNNGNASPGVYKVTVTVPENAGCNTDVLVYNTITPANRGALVTAVNNGIRFHGNKGNFNYIITSEITDMSRLFLNKLDFKGDISEWDTSQVTTMGDMFNNAKNFNGNISGWNTSQVITMRDMFRYAGNFKGNISGWKTGKVTDMSGMFFYASSFDQPLNKWNTKKVTNMEGMFAGANAFNGDISGWKTSNVTDMSYMFNSAEKFNGDISRWETGKVTDMRSMFQNAYAFNQPLKDWNTSNVQHMNNIFLNAKKFNQPIGGWNTGKVTDMGSMFYEAHAFNQPLSNWNTSQVANMSKMFYQAKEFDQPLSNWNTSKVTDMSYMFHFATNFNQPLSNWNTSQVKNMDKMFFSASNFNQDLSGWNVDKVSSHVQVFWNSAMEKLTAKHPKWKTP